MTGTMAKHMVESSIDRIPDVDSRLPEFYRLFFRAEVPRAFACQVDDPGFSKTARYYSRSKNEGTVEGGRAVNGCIEVCSTTGLLTPLLSVVSKCLQHW